MKNVILVSWSHVDLAFTIYLSEYLKNKFKIYRYSHHKDWTSKNRSYIKNFWHILKKIFYTLILVRGSQRIFFGTNLCRFFFPFYGNRNTIYIYNELPCLKYSFLGLYDRLIFRLSKKIYVSSEQRKFLLKEYKFFINNVHVLNNITFNKIDKIDFNKNFGKKIIFIGNVCDTRFGSSTKNIIEKYIKCGYTVDVLASHIQRNFTLSIDGIKYLSAVPHNEIPDLLRHYDFGLISYEPTSLNNIYAAPLKIFEYVNAGLRIISIHHNNGIDSIFKLYPNLFFNIDSIESSNQEFYMNDRNKFLSDAIYNNLIFSRDVINLV